MSDIISVTIQRGSFDTKNLRQGLYNFLCKTPSTRNKYSSVKHSAKRAVFCAYVAALLTAACATSGGVSGEGISLDEAVELSAEAIAEKLPGGTRVAVVAFDAENENLAGYIMDELTGALGDGGIEVAYRGNLEYVLKEQRFQASGLADDKTGAEVGKFLGAKYVITGQLISTGKEYRWRLSAINVETAVQEASRRDTVRNDRNFQRLLDALRNARQTARTARYAVTENSKPQTAGTFLDRGLLFLNRKDWDLAIEDFTEAIRLDPNNAMVYICRGVAYGDKGDYDRAIADHSQAIRLDPNYASAYNNRGNAYYNKGDYDRAIADCNQAIKLDPNYALAYFNRGVAYGNKGDYDRAMADYNQSIKLDPNNTYAYNNRGVVYKDKGDYDRAIADFTQAITLDPNYAMCYANRGEAYRMKSQYDAAIKDFDAVIRLNSSYDAYAYASRGVAYSEKGQKNQAIADLERAIQLDPNYQWAKDRLREIRGW